MQLAANLSWLYRHLDEPARFEAAAADGFEGVEILMPYAQPPAWYAAELRAAGLQLVLFNTPLGAGPGRIGWAAVPGAEAEFAASFAQVRAVAEATGCRRVHLMAGVVAGVPEADWQSVFRRNVQQALRWAEADGLVLCLEALNRADNPGYAYYLPEQVLPFLREFNSPHLRMQFDYYHCAKEDLPFEATVRECAPWIGHTQIAGRDGRYEPDLANPQLLEAVALLPELGYDSWLGCEYQARHTPAQGLVWCRPLHERGVLTLLHRPPQKRSAP